MPAVLINLNPLAGGNMAKKQDYYDMIEAKKKKAREEDYAEMNPEPKKKKKKNNPHHGSRYRY